jgi:hypothetical protein
MAQATSISLLELIQTHGLLAPALLEELAHIASRVGGTVTGMSESPSELLALYRVSRRSSADR